MSKKKVLFTIGRFIGVLLTPTFIYLINRFYSINDAEGLINLFVWTVFILPILNNDCYTDYYKEKFEYQKASLKLGNCLHQYIQSFLNHMLLSIIPMIIILLVFQKSILFISILLIHVIGEKFLDEVLRFQIFSKKYFYWLKLFFIRYLFVILLSFFLYYFNNYDLIFNYIAAYITIYLTHILLSRKEIYRVLKIALKSINFTRYIKQYKVNLFKLHALNYLSANILVVDKLIIYEVVATPIVTTQIYFTAQIANSLNLIADNLFLVFKRPEYLKIYKNIRDLLTNKYLQILSISFLAIATVTFILQDFIVEINFNYFLLIITYYLIYSLGQPIQQNLFWVTNRNILILIEAGYYLLIGIAALSLFKTSIYIFLLLVLLLMAIRFTAMGVYLKMRNEI